MRKSRKWLNYISKFVLHKIIHLKEIDKFIDRYHIRKSNQDCIDNLSRHITPKEMEAGIKSLLNKKRKLKGGQG